MHETQMEAHMNENTNTKTAVNMFTQLASVNVSKYVEKKTGYRF